MDLELEAKIAPNFKLRYIRASCSTWSKIECMEEEIEEFNRGGFGQIQSIKGIADFLPSEQYFIIINYPEQRLP